MTTRVLFDDGRTDASRRLAVFVDPVGGEVQGALTAYGSSGVLPAATWADELHRSLHLGEPGRVYAELAASWLGVVALVGLALWWTTPGRRRPTGRRADRLRVRMLPRRGVSGRRRTLSWHGVLGTWLVLGMLMLSATGLTWSRFAGPHVSELRTAMSWNTPELVTDVRGGADHAEGAGHADHGGGGVSEDVAALGDAPGVGYEQALRIAREEAGLVGPVEVTGPTSRTGTYVVGELDVSWPTSADRVSLGQAGDVVDVSRFEDHPFVAKLARWGIDLHMGRLFGVANQVGLVVLAAGIAVMTVLGYRMWWQRRPGPGRPPARGAWRSAPRGPLVGLALAAVVVGWFLPVLGVSLLAFLLLDVFLARRAARRPDFVRDPGDKKGVPPLDPSVSPLKR